MVKMLSELGLLHTRMGEILISAAIFDDVIGLFLLAILLSIMETGTFPDMATLALMVAKVTAFFAITVTLGVHVYPRVSRVIKAMQAAAIEFSAITIVALAYGLLAELLGMHWILGAFMAGLYFEKFFIRGNKTAGVRIRKFMQLLRREAEEIRKEVQNHKKNI